MVKITFEQKEYEFNLEVLTVDLLLQLVDTDDVKRQLHLYIELINKCFVGKEPLNIGKWNVKKLMGFTKVFMASIMSGE